MKCSRITLCERRQQRSAAPRHKCEPPRYLLSVQNYHSWLNQPCIKPCTKRISVSEIHLPDHVQHVTTPGLERWTQKRPRLKSSRRLFVRNETSECKLQVKSEERPDSEQLQMQQLVQEYSIDEHVQKLIEEANKVKDEQEVFEIGRKSKRKKRKGRRHKVLDMEEETNVRTVRMSVSRPASPDTEQVIRVDVVSNYSVEVRKLTKASTVSATTAEEDETIEVPPVLPPDLTLRCRRLRLTYRS